MKYFFITYLFVSILILSSCKKSNPAVSSENSNTSQDSTSNPKDSTGGPGGGKGGDGFVYFEGFKDSLRCAPCHTADADTTYYTAAKMIAWANSKHANGGHSSENGTDCAECHTMEGYLKKQTGIAVTTKNATPIGCFACHSPHKKGDFSLRTVAPVALLSNITGVSDAMFDYGKGNLCASCHQPRAILSSEQLDPGKSTATNDTIKITSNRWYSHYGLQSQILMGKGGYEWTNGPVAIDNSPHTTAATIKSEGCVVCHMADGVGALTGGHTMILSSEEKGEDIAGCKTSGCHGSSLTTLDYNGKQTETNYNLDTLKILLVHAGWLDTLSMTAKASSATPLVITPSNKAGALWNFFFIDHDLSQGVHNTKYANALLRNSIAKMRREF